MVKHNLEPVLIVKFHSYQIELEVLEVTSDQEINIIAHKKIPTLNIRQWSNRELELYRSEIQTFVSQITTQHPKLDLRVNIIVPALWYQYQTVTLNRTFYDLQHVEEFTPEKITSYLKEKEQIDHQFSYLFYMLQMLNSNAGPLHEHYLAYFMRHSDLKIIHNLFRSLTISQVLPDLEVWSHFFTTHHTPIKNYFLVTLTDNFVMVSNYEQGQIQTTEIERSGLKRILKQLADDQRLSVSKVQTLLGLTNPGSYNQKLAGSVPAGLVRKFLTLIAPKFDFIRQHTNSDHDRHLKPILLISPLSQTEWGQKLLQNELLASNFVWGHTQFGPWLFYDWVGTWGTLSLYQEFNYKYRYFKSQPLNKLTLQQKVNWGWRTG